MKKGYLMKRSAYACATQVYKNIETIIIIV